MMRRFTILLLSALALGLAAAPVGALTTGQNACRRGAGIHALMRHEMQRTER